MKKFLLIICLSLFSFFGYSQNFPAKPSKLVNDYTKTLSSTDISNLEQKLVAFDDSTSIQISVVMIQTLDGYDISDYGYQLGRAWGIGGSEKNTGILVLASLGDRKVTIQTGYGMEGALPDAIAKRIIENEIKPFFKQGDYYSGFDAGTDAIISYTKGEYTNDSPKVKSGKKGFPAGFIVLIVIFIIFIFSRGGKGGGGGGRNVIGGRGAANIFWWSMLAGMGNGGRSSGGFGGGGSSGGGGFGGFGGGSFGGGGASGSW